MSAAGCATHPLGASPPGRAARASRNPRARTRSVAAEAAAKGYRHVGLLGTRWLIDSDVYPAKLQGHGIVCICPEVAERKRLGEIIMTELVYGTFDPGSIAYIEQIIARLKETEGCDAVALACTELPLILNDANSTLPTLDSTRLLARAALAQALAEGFASGGGRR